MNNQEGSRYGSLSWKREAHDLDLWQQAPGQRDGGRATGPCTFSGVGLRGGATRGADRTVAGGVGMSGSVSGLRKVEVPAMSRVSQDSASSFSGAPMEAPARPSALTRAPVRGSGEPVPSPENGLASRASSGPQQGGSSFRSSGAPSPALTAPLTAPGPANQSSSSPRDRRPLGPRVGAVPSPATSAPQSAGSGAPAPLTEQLHAWRPQRALNRQEEIARNVKSLLNKLTVEKFSVLAEKIARVLDESLASTAEVRLIVDVIIEKAVTEPDWSEMYADLCQVLQWRSVAPEGEPETVRKTPFMVALLNRIQTEFEAMHGVLRQSSKKGGGEEGSTEETLMKKRILGVVKLIGELFHRKLLGFKVVNDVVVELVMKSDTPDEHLIECFLELIATVGYFIDQNPKFKVVLDSWFGRLRELQNKPCYSKRLKCVIQDTFDMRRAEWRKKIHKDRAKALSELHDQLETEEVLGGSIHAAQYGNIVVVGERTNLNGQYLGYLQRQEALYDQKVARRVAAASSLPRRPPP